MATSYSNTGGSGDRRSSITITHTLSGYSGYDDFALLINGNLADDNFAWAGETDATKYVRFDFGSGSSKIIDEVSYYQSGSTATSGTFQWQGSNDGSTWTSIGSTFVLGGTDSTATPQVISLAGNTTGYRFYQMLGVSGSSNYNPWVNEFTFKISDAAATFTASGSVAAHKATGGGSATFAAPVYTAAGSMPARKATAGGAITFTVPIYTTAGSVAARKATAAATITFTLPVYTAAGAGSVRQATAGGAITFIRPVYTVSGTAAIRRASSSGLVSSGAATFHVAGSLVIRRATLAATATFAPSTIAGWLFYRGRNQPSQIDYATIIATAAIGSRTATLPALDWSASKTWWLAICHRSAAGKLSVGTICKLLFDAAGHWIGPTPNAPSGLAVQPAAGGCVRATWFYNPAGQLAPASSFKVFVALDNRPFDFTTPAATVAATSAPVQTWLSTSYGDGRIVRVIVRAAGAAPGYLAEHNQTAAWAVTDAVAPPTPQMALSSP